MCNPSPNKNKLSPIYFSMNYHDQEREKELCKADYVMSKSQYRCPLELHPPHILMLTLLLQPFTTNILKPLCTS
jgi:hypothetical protein